MDKFSELKAAALAATPGPWILDDDSWSEGDNANVSTEERYDGRIVSIAQIEGGGSESGFDEPFSAEQQANARYITAANPAVVLALLAEQEREQEMHAQNLEIKTLLAEKVKTLETKLWDRQQLVDAKSHSQNELLSQIRDLEERYGKDMSSRGKRICELDDLLEAANKRIAELEAKLATPIKIVNYDEFFICHASGASDDYCKGWVDGRNAAARDVGKAGFTVEDKQ